jgi:hypothetical protein
MAQQGKGDREKDPHTAPDDVGAVLDAARQRSADRYAESCQKWNTDDVVVFVNQDPERPDAPPQIFAAPREYVLAKKERTKPADAEEAAFLFRMAEVYANLVQRAPRGTFWLIFGVNGKLGLTYQAVED